MRWYENGKYMGQFSLKENSPKRKYKHTWEYRKNKYVRPFVLKVIVPAAILFAIGAIIAPAAIKRDKEAYEAYTVREAEANIEIVDESPAAVLGRIAEAESWNSHYCTEKIVKLGGCPKGAIGQVLVNKTLDVGRYAINLTYNGKWCADRGYDIFKEKDNEECAKELFNERGSTPWDASRNKWNK